MVRIMKWLPALIWMAIIYYLSSIPNLELRGELSAYDHLLRKAAHVFEYFVLTLLLALPNYPKPIDLKISLRLFLFATVYALLDEIHQSFVPTRDGKMMDVLIDSFGIISAVILLYQWNITHKTHNKRSRSPNNSCEKA